MNNHKFSKEKSGDHNILRAFLKIALVALVLIGLVGLVALFADDSVIDTLKFNLSLGALILLVVMINVISFVCFIALYAAYQWVRRDLKSPHNADMDDDQKDAG